jgi:hypothetical protein
MHAGGEYSVRTLVGFGLSLLLATGLFAQHRGGFSNPRPFVQGTFGNVRLGGSVAGSGFRGQSSVPGTRRPMTVVMYGYPVAYGYPVFVGGYLDNAYPAEAAPQQQPDTTVIEAAQPAPAIVQRFGSDDAQDPTTPVASAADDLQPVEAPDSTFEPSHYLIAFKDHSIYSAVAYWVDGDTLHYFTSGNTHNQASVSLVDRDLTERLNKESGLELKLPPAK